MSSPIPFNRPCVAGKELFSIASETPLGHRVRFPWGTSILAVMRKAGE